MKRNADSASRLPADRQTLRVTAPGVWKLVIEHADKGVLDDVWVTPAPGAPGFFSLSSDAVLRVQVRK